MAWTSAACPCPQKVGKINPLLHWMFSVWAALPCKPRLELPFQPTRAPGFREVTGSIESSKGRLLLTNYESLTMAAQFPDTSLPQRHEQDQLLRVPPALYNCRIVQLSNPETRSPFKERLNFLYEITNTAEPTEPWSDIPWKPA